VPVIGLHCSHEQIPPSRLLTHVREAEAAGFRAAMSSDHFSPWSERQGESGFAWSFLGAALEATSLPFGVVNAPGQRYHPAIIAQAAATLCELFPGRLWVALGTGEASNEHITGDPWPNKAQRNARLRDCVDIMRALFAGEVVDHDGLVRVDRARLWTLPAEPPSLVAAKRKSRLFGEVGIDERKPRISQNLQLQYTQNGHQFAHCFAIGRNPS
jgi:G6PDH family F420-dependent oxidoreductase